MQQVQGDQSSDRSKALFDTKTSTFVQLTEGVFNRIRIQNQSRALQVRQRLFVTCTMYWNGSYMHYT